MTKFSDIIKNSVLENYSAQSADIVEIMIILLVTLLISLYIFFAYRLLMRNSLSSKSFNVSLGVITIVTATIIIAMQSNLVISLGMVGALSIVRFRTAIKEPMDLVFLFWSISMGIVCGAQLFELAFLASIGITLAIVLFQAIPVAAASQILVVRLVDIAEEPKIVEDITGMVSNSSIKCRNLIQMGEKTGLEIVMEIRCKKEQELMVLLGGNPKVTYVTMVKKESGVA